MGGTGGWCSHSPGTKTGAGSVFLEKHTEEEDPETDEYVQHGPAASGERGRGAGGRPQVGSLGSMRREDS